MSNLIKSLITKTRTAPTPEEAEALQRTYETLQFRVMQIALAAPKPDTRAACAHH
jgi:hypothetical protein